MHLYLLQNSILFHVVVACSLYVNKKNYKDQIISDHVSYACAKFQVFKEITYRESKLK